MRTLARQCVLDYVALHAAPARKEELTGILLAEMPEQGGAPIATVIGHAARLPVLSAALVNGAASHALDFDDVNLAMTGASVGGAAVGTAGAGGGARQSGA